MDAPLAIRLKDATPILPAPEQRRRARERALLRLSDVGTLLRVDASTISRWERGKVEPHGSARLLYAAFLVRLTSTQKPPNEDTPPGDTDGASITNDAAVRSRSGYRPQPVLRRT
jgi:transcriptional regulator with XRE-family HTH domain